MDFKEFHITDSILPGDIGELISLQSRYYFEEFGYGLEFEAYISRLFSEFVYRHDLSEALWKATKDGRIVGSVALFREDETTARLRLLFVHPEERGKGLGKALVDLAVEFAGKHRYSSIVLMTEDILTSAGKIYEKTGFEIIETERTNMWGVDCELQTYRKVL